MGRQGGVLFGNRKKEVPLFSVRDYRPIFYCIGTTSPEKDALKIRTTDEKEYLLQFMDYENASRFFRWLMIQKDPNRDGEIHIGNETVWFKGGSLSQDQLTGYGNLRIMEVSDLYDN